MKKPLIINLELTSKCDYQCITCLSRDQRRELQCHDMSKPNFDLFIHQVKDYFAEGLYLKEIINAGYGESLLSENLDYAFNEYKKLKQFIEEEYNKKLNISVVTNGYCLDEKKIKIISKSIDILKFSFPSSVPDRYLKVTVQNKNMKIYNRVIENVKLVMQANLENRIPELRFHISPPCKISNEDTEKTINFLAKLASEIGLKTLNLVTFPSTSNRSGLVEESEVFNDEVFYEKNRKYDGKLINGVKIRMLSEIQVFYPSNLHICSLLKQKFPCIWQNGSLSIDASGSYRFCINDVMTKNSLGNIANFSLRDAEKKIMAIEPEAECFNCNENPYFLKGNFIESLFSFCARNFHRIFFNRMKKKYDQNTDE